MKAAERACWAAVALALVVLSVSQQVRVRRIELETSRLAEQLLTVAGEVNTLVMLLPPGKYPQPAALDLRELDTQDGGG